ncbi:hypothetical protein [uncultured Winogradskyella sp.]|uniref:hypothetical protein n=1 Tax=uncultured Winogradskyella sp. TaxID=395353 RepID=UPI0026396C7D|nr:hypothetical protein [uncultured Winogradskyella sp.]
MARLESNTTIQRLKKTNSKQSALRSKVWAALTLLGISGLLTLSYMNDNIFIEHIAICGFIISCIAIIKLMETH